MKAKELYPLFLKSTGVCTDTRKIEKGNLFIALKGDNFNGNTYAQQAIDGGALACIVDDPAYVNPEGNIYLVEDGLKFLQSLAQYHRQQLDIPFIGLTGSNGKTTTKELIASCLEPKFKVAYTQGNFNNHIGVPLTLLSIDESHEIAVIEMGANHLGEIASLCKIAQPDYGYITNFGKAHIEGFGSEEGVVKGKSELYQYLNKSKGIAFINAEDEKQVALTKSLKNVSFGFHQQAVYNFHSTSTDGLASIRFESVEFTTQLNGAYNEANIAAAATIALNFGVSREEIQQALKAYTPNLNRSQEVIKKNTKILLDAYNANPTSMEAALHNFASLDGTKTVILGDMFELGETSAQEHHHIAKLVSTLNFEKIILIGHNFQQVKLAHPSIFQFVNRETFIGYLKENPIATDRILVKGSRGMALEKVLEFI